MGIHGSNLAFWVIMKIQVSREEESHFKETLNSLFHDF